MDLKRELGQLKGILPWEALLLLVAGGLLALFHGLSWYLLFFAGGIVVGTFLLDLDQVLAKYLGTQPDFFHNFRGFMLVFILAVFVVTSSGSMMGKGMVLAMMVHAFLAITERQERRIAAGLIGVGLLLLWF